MGFVIMSMMLVHHCGGGVVVISTMLEYHCEVVCNDEYDAGAPM